jgi:hypothetical protein
MITKKNNNSSLRSSALLTKAAFLALPLFFAFLLSNMTLRKKQLNNVGINESRQYTTHLTV